MDFDFVLVDEATQTKEPTLLCALAAGAKSLVLIGDQMQLGPSVTVRQASVGHFFLSLTC